MIRGQVVVFNQAMTEEPVTDLTQAIAFYTIELCRDKAPSTSQTHV